MRKQDISYTLINIAVAHFFISVLSALVFGVSHPLSGLYRENNPLIYILASVALMMPFYAISGYLYILSKDSLYKMNKSLLAACVIFAFALLGLYATCYLLVYFRVIKNAWIYYVIFNYPNALIFNSISLKIDGLNLLFSITALSAPIAFYLGGMYRYRYESAKIE